MGFFVGFNFQFSISCFVPEIFAVSRRSVAKYSRKTSEGSSRSPIFRGGTPQILDMHFQIWFTSQLEAKFGLMLFDEL